MGWRRVEIVNARFLIIPVLIASLQLNASQAQDKTIIDLEKEIQKIEDASGESILILNQMLSSAETDKQIDSQMMILDKLSKVLNSAGQLEKAKSAANKLRRVAIDSENIEYQINALVTQSQIAKSSGDYNAAAEFLEKEVIPLAEQNGHQSLPEHFRLLGIYKRNLGLYREAESNYSKALAKFLENKDELGAGKTYSALGVLFESRGELKDAFENHLKARVIFEKYNDINQLATNYFNLGEMYRRTGEPEKALNLFERALDMDIKRNNKSDMAYSFTKVASMLEHEGKVEEALNHSEKSIRLFKALGDHRMLSWALPLYARLNKKLGNLQGYYQALKLTEETAQKSGSKIQLRNVYQMLALHHYNEGDIELARQQIELAMRAMQGLDQDVITHDVHAVFSKVLAAQGEHEKAFEQLKVTHKLYMELNENEHADAQEKYKKDVNLLEEKFRVSELEQKNILQQKVLEQEKFQRNMIFILLAAIFIIILMFAYVQFNRRKLAVYKSDLIVESLDKKNTYLAEVAHDLRHPLSVLSNHLEALEDGIVEPSEKSFKTLHGRIQQLNRLVGDLRSASLVEIGALSLHIRTIPFKEFIEEQIDLYRPLISKVSLQVENELDIDSDLKLDVDKDRIAQVLGNLLKNCVRYTNKGGTIKVSAHCDDKFLNLIIEDSTPSVNDEELGRLFDRLYRSESTKSMSEKGTGLGLSISKSIVEAHGGEIVAAQSKLGGLAIKIALPLIANA